LIVGLIGVALLYGDGVIAGDLGAERRRRSQARRLARAAVVLTARSFSVCFRQRKGMRSSATSSGR
jgi:hypothetical protein